MNLELKEKTIMDVMGNTRDENVCSNMLAFYLNPNEEHDLDNLVLKALIETLISKKQLTDFKYENISIIREYQTLKGNRIDIIIENSDCVIGIENKLEASLYNDLIDYSNTLDTLKNYAVKVVLSLNPVDVDYDNTGFINITYDEFLDSLEKLMKNYTYKDKKWYLYLEDFIVNLKGNIVEYNFRKKIEPKVDSIDKMVDYYNAEMQTKTEELKNIIVNRKLDRKEVIIGKTKLDKTVYILMNKFNMDARLTANGWSIGIYVYTNNKVFEVRDFLNDNGIKIMTENNQHLWLKHFDYNEDIQFIAEYYLKIYNLLREKF